LEFQEKRSQVRISGRCRTGARFDAAPSNHRSQLKRDSCESTFLQGFRTEISPSFSSSFPSLFLAKRVFHGISCVLIVDVRFITFTSRQNGGKRNFLAKREGDAFVRGRDFSLYPGSSIRSEKSRGAQNARADCFERV